MIQLKDQSTGEIVGHINEAQLKFLIDQLEEEYEGDMDYYLDAATLEMLITNGADADLIRTLTAALGDKPELEIVWSKE